MGKRSRAVTKGLKPKKSITGAQRKARKLNIEVARRAKKKGSASASVSANPRVGLTQTRIKKYTKTVESMKQHELRSTIGNLLGSHAMKWPKGVQKQKLFEAWAGGERRALRIGRRVSAGGRR